MDEISALGRERLWTHARVMMLTAAFDGTILAVNPAWTDILGWPADQLLGQNFFDFIHPDDVSRTKTEAASLANGNQTPKFENRYRRADGSYRDIDWTAVSDDKFIHAVGRDNTIEREQADALLAAEEAMRQSQKLDAIGQLTGSVAHDFNNLLTVITGSVQLLRNPQISEERRLRYMNAIEDTAARATALTKQLLAFARQQALIPEPFDARDSLQRLLGMLSTLAGSRIDVDLQISPEGCLVFADQSQFDTSIVNMAINARDATVGDGRITVKVEPVSEVPAIRAHPPFAGNFVAVSISDTGAGIALEDLPRIFEPFYTTKEVGSGTGLGLSQVFGFTKQSGGEIQVESVLGQGTTFTMYLPQSDLKPDKKSAGRKFLTDGKGKRILVVEDNKDVAEFVCEALTELGFDVSRSPNAADALTKLAGDGLKYDLVFSDVVMPGMSGLDLGRELRNLYPQLPILLTSGYSRVLAQGNRHSFKLLHKPYSMHELSTAIGESLAATG